VEALTPTAHWTARSVRRQTLPVYPGFFLRNGSRRGRQVIMAEARCFPARRSNFLHAPVRSQRIPDSAFGFGGATATDMGTVRSHWTPLSNRMGSLSGRAIELGGNEDFGVARYHRTGAGHEFGSSACQTDLGKQWNAAAASPCNPTGKIVVRYSEPVRRCAIRNRALPHQRRARRDALTAMEKSPPASDRQRGVRRGVNR